MEYINADLTKIYDSADYPLGAKCIADGNEYRFVAYNDGDGDVAGVAGQLVYYAYSGTTTVGAFTVTMDYDTATVIKTYIQAAAGFLQAALTNGKYGWIQTKGINKIAMLTNNNVAAGEAIIPAAADGTVDGVAAAAVTTREIGFAMADDSGTAQAVGTAYINCM